MHAGAVSIDLGVQGSIPFFSQTIPDKLDNFGCFERLLQNREGSGCPRSGSVRGARPTGNDDDRYLVAAPTQFFKKIEAAHSRHVDIKN